MEVEESSPQLMEIDSNKATETTSEETSKATETTSESSKATETEPDSFPISNLSRIIPQQLPMIKFPADGKYQPVSGRWRGEIVVLRDCNPSKSAEYFEPSDIKIISATPEGNEPAPPKPFEIPPELQ